MAQQSKLFNADRQIDRTGPYCPMPAVKTREGHDRLRISRSRAAYRFVVRKTR